MILPRDGNGEVTLDLTALTSAPQQSVAVEADGQTWKQVFTITPGAYALTASPSELTQYKETAVVFMLTQGGMPVPQGTEITLSGKGVIFDGKAQNSYVTQDANGTIEAKVLASQTGASMSALVGGKTVTINLRVTTAAYTLTANPAQLTQHKAEKVVFTLKANSQPLPNAKVIFKSNSDFIGLPTTEQLHRFAHDGTDDGQERTNYRNGFDSHSFRHSVHRSSGERGDGQHVAYRGHGKLCP